MIYMMEIFLHKKEHKTSVRRHAPDIKYMFIHVCARMCVCHVEPEFTSGAILLVAFLSYHLRCHLSLTLEFNNLTGLQISHHQSASPVLELQAPLNIYEVAGD